ncbi:hypothetical protein ABH926_009996 [Catenulispora sp. GP43]
MDVVHQRVAALDISKTDAKVCIRVPGKRKGTFTREVTTWGATTNQILALRDHLVAAGGHAGDGGRSTSCWRTGLR